MTCSLNFFIILTKVKTNHGLFPKVFIQEALKDAPGGVHIVLEGVASNNAHIVAVGYKCNKNKVILFVSTRRGASTRPAQPYKMKLTNADGNICICEVDRPDLCTIYFARSNNFGHS